MSRERFTYVGPPVLTRGDYGEPVENIYRETDTSYPDNDVCVVWDSSYGWQIWCSWGAAIYMGWVGEPGPLEEEAK